MKALVIGGANIRFMPYLFFYLDKLIELKYEVTLFFWDRDGLQDHPLPVGIKVVRFKKKMLNETPKYTKIGNFLKFRQNAIKQINSENYDRIIVCCSQFVILLSDILLKKYKDNYIFDYRDPSYEHIKIYKKRLETVTLNSKATFVSSDAYRTYLPKNGVIYTTHNITLKDLEQRKVRKLLNRNKEKIHISFWGYIRCIEINIAIIKCLANDVRFEIHFHGTFEKTAQDIFEYCNTMQIYNVYVHKEYLPDDRYKFAKETDIIHNMYNDNHKMAMGNKFYDGIIFYIPQICTKDSFMAKEVAKYDVGLAIDPSKNFADELYNYYKNINWVTFEKKCDECLENVLREYKDSDLALEKILYNKNIIL